MDLVYSDFISLDYSGKPTGEVAESWESSEECTSWLFNINSNIAWHDGGTLDAEDVISTINYIKTKGGIYSENVKYIKSFEAVDPLTVKIICTEPCSALPCMMTFPVLKKESINTVGVVPVGSGMYAYSYTKSTVGKLVLERFNDYYGNKPYISAVEINVCASEEERYKAESDFAVITDGVMNPSLIKDNIHTYRFAGNILTLFYFNLNGDDNYAAVNDVNVRQAINSYMDRGTLMNAGAAGNAEPAVLPIIKGNFLISGDGASEESSCTAGDEYMKVAGYIKDDNGIWSKDGTVIDLVCIVPENDIEFLLLAEKLERDLELKGISVTLKFCNSSDYANAIKNGTYSMAVAQISLAEWIDFKSIFKTGAALNINSFSDDNIDSLIDSAMISGENSVIYATYNDISVKLKELLPVCCVYIKRQNVVVSDRLKGVAENGLYFWDVFNSVDKWYIE